jgi:hypothetical protein
MSTWQEHDRRCRSEHKLVAHGTVTLQTPFHALVVPQSDTHASIALVAMEVVDAETLPDAANVAVGAVVYVLIRVVVKEAARFTKVI